MEANGTNGINHQTKHQLNKKTEVHQVGSHEPDLKINRANQTKVKKMNQECETKINHRNGLHSGQTNQRKKAKKQIAITNQIKWAELTERNVKFADKKILQIRL